MPSKVLPSVARARHRFEQLESLRLVSPHGGIYGATIIGKNSGEMINLWALAIQNRINIRSIMMVQHSFRTMPYVSKRAAEAWVMNKISTTFRRGIVRLLF